MFEFNATFIVAMVSFVVFIMIMNAIFYKPILNIIRKREDYINSNYENSKEFEKSAKEFEQTHAAGMSKAQEDCRKRFNSDVSKFQNEANDKIKEAKDLNKAEIQKKKENLLNCENELKNTVNNTIVHDLADIVVSKITTD